MDDLYVINIRVVRKIRNVPEFETKQVKIFDDFTVGRCS